MTTTDRETKTTTDLEDFAVGDQVVLKRCLDHPAHMKQVPGDPRDGGIKWVRDDSVVELIGVTTVMGTRHVPAISGWGGRAEKNLVRLVNGFWYDCATGLQDGSGATR